MATPQEIERIRQYENWLAEQEARPKTRPTNPNAGQAQAAPPVDMNGLLQMMLQQQQNIPVAKDEGLLGGISQSPRNPGGRLNTGIDWVKANYNPNNNPFEGRNIQAEAAGAVSGAKADQLDRLNKEVLGIAKGGTLSRDVGGANMTSFYGADRGDQAAAYALKNPTQPLMNVLNIPEQYGGGMGYGSSMPLPQADPSLLLPTGGYNPQAGVGGSGVPMSAGEAQGTDLVGPGIYGERDRSNPASQDAIMARGALTQGGIKQRLKEFYENPFSDPVGHVEPQPLQPVAPQAPPQAAAPQRPLPQFDEMVNYGTYAGGNSFGPPLLEPTGSPALNVIPSALEQLVGGAAGVNDAINNWIANPLIWALTGKENYFEPNATKAWAYNLFR